MSVRTYVCMHIQSAVPYLENCQGMKVLRNKGGRGGAMSAWK